MDAIQQCQQFLSAIFMPEDTIEFRPVPKKRWGTLADLPEIVPWLHELNNTEHHAYFGANPRKATGASDASGVLLSRCLFADHDNGVTWEEALERIKAAGLPWPTAVVHSGNGVHPWWRLDEPITDAAEWTRRQKQIANAIGSDVVVSDWPRIMRLPGFVNHKYPHKPVAELIDCDPSRVYTVAQLTPKPHERRRMGNIARDFIEHGTTLPAGRHHTMFHAACDLARNGWSKSETINTLMQRMRKWSDIPDIEDCPRQIGNGWSKGAEERTHGTAATIVVSATDNEPHSGGADLSRPHTLTDVGLGRRLAKMIRGRMTYVRERKTWLYWDGRRHADQGEHIAEQYAKRLHDEMWGDLAALDHHERTSAVVKFVHDSGTRARIAAAIAMAQSEPGINTSQAEYDSHPWLLNVRNGVVDLRSGELLPHDSELRITQLAAVEFAPDARSVLWERFIREVTRDDDDVAEFLQQVFGLALTGDVSDEVLICHNGGGCNGKSTALEAVGKMLGDYAAVAPPGLFTARKFDSHPTELAGLRGKRFVTAIEQEGNRALRESLIKQMTGGDTIRTRGMREDFWEMQPTWHIHIAYNTAPRLTGTDDGIRRRLVVVPWNASFKGAPDATVKERLTGEAERAGILNWCLEGLRKRLAFGRLEVPEACRISTDEYIDDEDIVGRFIAERTEIEQGHIIELREMLRVFREWMQADGSPRHVVDGYTANALGRELARRGFRKMRPDSGVHRKQTVVMGLRLVHTADDLPGYHDEAWATFHR
jgi:P4 family phage/plasmid primase-like protien